MMSAQARWRIVAAREVMVKLTDKAWLLTTLVMTAIIVGFCAFSAIMNGRVDTTTVAVTSPEAASIVNSIPESTSTLPGFTSGDIESREFPDPAAARAGLTDGSAKYYLAQEDGGWVLYAGEAPGSDAAAISTAVSAYVMERNATAAGTSLAQLGAGSALRVETVVDAQEGTQSAIATGVGAALAFIFYISSLIYGMTIAQSVIEEKQSRLAEILATSVPMTSLLAGKVIGNTVLALMQTMLYVVIGLIGAKVTGLEAMLPTLPSAVWWFLAFFIVGFVALAATWAVAGSLASRQEDLSYTSTPMMSVVIIAFMVPLFASGTWMKVASFVPIVSSVAMPMRILDGSAAWWEPPIALGLTVLAGLGLIVLGARLYRNSLLRTGGRLRYRDALQAMD